MGILRAGFDASGNQDPDNFVLVGMVFSREGAAEFERRWGELFAPYGGSHWVDLTSRTEAFKDISPDERNRLVKAAAAILGPTYEHCVISGCRHDDFRALQQFAPRIDGLCSAYALSCSYSARYLAGWLNQEGRPDSINYCFEAGDEGEGEVDRFFLAIQADARLTEEYRYGGHDFAPKGKCVLTEAADCMAWHVAKYKREFFDRRGRGLAPVRERMRLDMAHIYEIRRCSFRFLTRREMVEHLQFLNPWPWPRDDADA